MKILPFLFFFLHLFCYSEADTTWLDKKWQATQKENASYYRIDFPGNIQRIIYRTGDHRIFMTGYYNDSAFSRKTGPFVWYDVNGMVTDSILYQNDRIVRLQHFHSNGKPKTLLIYGDSSRAVYVNSWDENGKETFIDTFYHDRKGKDCHKDTAHLQGIITREDDLWHLRFFSIPKQDLVIDSWYLERLCKNRTRYFTNFDNNKPIRSVEYGKAGVISLFKYWKYHRNGMLCNYRVYGNDQKFSEGKNWDSSGIQIPLDTSRFPASLTENAKIWQKKLVKNINDDPSIPWKTRKNYNGNLNISIKIDYSGNTTYTLSEKSLYPDMDDLIFHHFSKTTVWKPGIIQGCCVISYFTLNIVYQDGKIIQVYKQRKYD